MDNIKINIYGGIQQIIPNAKEVTQYVHTKDGRTTIVTKIKTEK